jgi:hypothetical protein
MHPNVHRSFSNISANQTYDMDDVLSELKRSRSCWLDGLKSSFDVASKAAENCVSISNFYLNPSNSARLFLHYHNAVVVAENLKKSGVTTVVMNPRKDLCDQIIAMATRENCSKVNLSDSTGVGVQAAQQRLRGAGSLGEP